MTVLRSSSNSNSNNIKKSKKVNQNDRCIGFNVSMPISEFLALDNQAQAEGVSRSELVRKAIQHYYQSQSNDKQP